MVQYAVESCCDFCNLLSTSGLGTVSWRDTAWRRSRNEAVRAVWMEPHQNQTSCVCGSYVILCSTMTLGRKSKEFVPLGGKAQSRHSSSLEEMRNK